MTPLTIGVVAEHAADERRVALVPDAVQRLATRGLSVVVEPGAGAGALIPDALYVAAGAQISADAWQSDVVLKVAPPSPEEVLQLQEGATLIGFLTPLDAGSPIAALDAHGITAFAMEAIPRISRAQAMDALSSQSTVTGYEAALIAASLSLRFLPMLTTAAGTIPPARVLVLGVGVAGLQALATTRRLGARTTGYDVRPDVAEQVRSLGAEWLDLGIVATGDGGYARALTADELAQQQRALDAAIKGFDIVITTALVPGRPAPRMVTARAVAGMKPGSVIVDLAGGDGGNCELTEPGKVVVRHDVTIASPPNLPSVLAQHASQLYARNVQTLLELMLDDDGRLSPDFDDEIIAGACVAGALLPSAPIEVAA
jgi:proton-translocating NAD(P)+ transhydrogenase subunit alpha